MDTELRSLRFLIQQRQTDSDPGYRLMVYGHSGYHRHCDFDNRETLVTAIQTALPDFDTARLLLKASADSTSSLVFVEVMSLDDLQLSVLGLD